LIMSLALILVCAIVLVATANKKSKISELVFMVFLF
jgi:hypothetical protein